MPNDQPQVTEAPISAPEFESLTVEVRRSSTDLSSLAKAAVERAWARVATGVRGSEAWTVEPVHPSRPEAFDLLAPADLEVTIDEAWNLAYALREETDLLDAEPSFEISLDNTLDTEELVAGPVASLATSSDALAGTGDDRPDWSPEQIKAPAAWDLTPPQPEGKSRGEGIVIGHPDSGFRQHNELFDPASGEANRILSALGRDFVDRDLDSEDEDANHGLGTASVLMSNDNRSSPKPTVTGVAPRAELIPLRVAKKRRLIPEPVLFRSGMRRLRQAIDYAVDLAQGTFREDIALQDQRPCHVISISLGWLPNRGVHRAVKRAVENNLIVCAAAGNFVRFVIWPAHYPEVIAVAGSNVDRQPWKGSSRGRTVDITAPAKNVWRAQVDKDGDESIDRGSGTSYSVASAAGVAALWLAHHGRDFLLDRYADEFNLTTVFRHVLTAAADPLPPELDGRFGAGIVNAERTLLEPLPTLAQLRASSAPILEAAFAAPVAAAGGGFERVVEAFDGMSPVEVRANLSRSLEVDDRGLDETLDGLGDELTFHLLTNPSLREAIMPQDESMAAASISEGLMGMAPADAPVGFRDEILATGGMSQRLRDRLF